MVVRKKRRRRKRKGHYHTGAYTSTKTGQVCKYRSGWELVYLQWLDGHAAVKTFGYESIKIPYISNTRTGKVRNYFPDFLIEFNDGSKQLVEIKPKRKLKQLLIQKKLKAAEVWCLEHGASLVVITEVELKVMGLLK
jgi:hypothetical protein